MLTTLHILTPHSQQTPVALAGQVAPGDRIADLRRFPPLAYDVGDDGICRDITDDVAGTRDYWTVARDWLAGLTGQTGLQDMLSIKGYGFWWTHVGQKFVAGLTELGNSFAWIDLLHALCAELRPERVLVHGQHSASLHLAREICSGVEVEVRAEKVPGPQRRTRIPRQLGLLVVRLVLGLAYVAYSLIRRPQILLLSNTNLLRETGIGPQRRLRDVYLGEVEAALRAQGWRVAVAEMYGWNATWAGLATRGLFFPSELVTLLSFPVWTKVGFHRQTVRKWRERWARVQPVLVPHLRYRGYDVASLVEPLVSQEFLRHAPRLEIMVGIWQRLLGLWQPRLLYINNAYGESQIPAIIAAKLLSIPTVEQQHGLIGRNHLAYLVPRHLDVETEYPLCERILVWGSYTQRLLAQAGVYQPKDAIVVGFPRTDMLLRELPPRLETRAQLGIPVEAPAVLYTSNEFAGDQRREILDSIQQALSPDIHWLIKLHPREKTRHLWTMDIRERGLQTTQVLEGEFDFYALLNACDLHVSFASTTLIEAAILGKPNLGLDIPHIADPGGYAEVNAFLPVPPGELGSAVWELLANPVQRARMLDLQKAFAEDWCLHDGKSVERIVAELESIATQERGERDQDALVA
jgi:hypothetical protein